MAFGVDEIIAATRIANDEPFPLAESAEMGYMLDEAIMPAMNALPTHLRCEVVEMGLKTVFAMGVSIGMVLERGS